MHACKVMNWTDFW